MMERGAILESLKKVIDPEIGISIVDVGLVYRIDNSVENRIEIDYTLTTPGCPLADVIENDIRTVLREEHGTDNVQLNLVWSPAWSIEFMSEEARLELGYPI